MRGLTFCHGDPKPKIKKETSQSSLIESSMERIFLTQKLLQPTEDEMGKYHIEIQKTTINKKYVLDHISKQEYRVFRDLDIENYQVKGIKINDESTIMSSISEFIDNFTNDTLEVNITWIEILNNPGIRSIFSIDNQKEDEVVNECDYMVMDPDWFR